MSMIPRQPSDEDAFIVELRTALNTIDSLHKKLNTTYNSNSQEQLARRIATLYELGQAYSQLPGPKSLALANHFYQEAHALANTSNYPAPWKATTVAMIHTATTNLSKERGGQIRQEQIAKQETRDLSYATEKPYKGYWVKPKAYILPTVEIILSLLLILAFLQRIPITRFLRVEPYACASGNITINGSTALLPFLRLAQGEYGKLCGTQTKISLNQLPNGQPLSQGSANGLIQLLQTNSPINVASTDTYADATADPTLNLIDHQVAVVVFALVVNKFVTQKANNLPIRTLSNDQIAAIYNGDINDWQDVDKSFNSGALSVISRPASSETRATFEKYVLGNTETTISPPDLLTDIDSKVADAICNTKGAIGYVPLYYYSYYHLSTKNKDCLQVVAINGYNPLVSSVVTSKPYRYQFWSLEHLYTKGNDTELTQTFLSFMHSDTMMEYFHQYDRYGYLSPFALPDSMLASH